MKRKKCLFVSLLDDYNIAHKTKLLLLFQIIVFGKNLTIDWNQSDFYISLAQ